MNRTIVRSHIDNNQFRKVKEMRTEGRFIVIIIEASSIRKFIALEMGFGTACYYAAKIVFINELAAIGASIIGVEAAKRGLKQIRRK